MKTIKYIFLILYVSSFANPSLDSLLTVVRSNYYNTQNQLNNLFNVQVNDSLHCVFRDGFIAKITLTKKNFKKEFFYPRGSYLPLFVFEENNKKQNRYYFDLGSSINISTSNEAHIFKWIDSQKREYLEGNPTLVSMAYNLLLESQNLKFICENHLTGFSESSTILELIKNLENKEYKQLENKEDFHNVGFDSYQKYESGNIIKEVEEHSLDCAGGMYSKIIKYNFNKSSHIEVYSWENMAMSNGEDYPNFSVSGIKYKIYIPNIKIEIERLTVGSFVFVPRLILRL